ncbi:MAG: hypothetical protein EBW55_12310, partial [Betaproteobacteria bacterium]|nr:hypothetical protein [Betaproteobacteria bacterium]
MKTHQPIQASAPDNMQTAKPASRHGLPRRTHRPSALTNGPRKPHLAVSDAPVQAEPESDPFGTGEAPEEDLAPVSVEEHESASLFTDGESGFDALQTLSQEDHKNAALSLEPPAPVDISHEFVPTRLAEHRKALMRMARLRVRSHEWAEDAVQEALIAAYQSRGSYRGRGSVRSWLRGILDHKIHDRFRAECHYTQADWIDDESASAEEQLDWAARCGVMGLRAHEDPMEICSRRQRLQRVAQGLN